MCRCQSVRIQNFCGISYANKHMFQRTSVQDFPLLEELKEFKSYVFNITSNKLDAEEVDQVDVGYVGASNTKFYVRDSTQVLYTYIHMKAASSTREMSLCFFKRKVEKRRAPKKCPMQQTPNFKTSKKNIFYTTRSSHYTKL